MLPQVQKLLAVDPPDVRTATIDELRAHRDTCQAVESSLSYGRRMVQGRLDIVASELGMRRAGAPESDLADLIERLPSILAERAGASQAGARAVTSLEPVTIDADLDQALDEIVHVDTLASLVNLDQGDLELLVERLAAFEQDISNQRRSMHERIDTVQAEIAGRYERGEVTVDSLLS